MEDLKNQIEALLFASGKFMSEENLSLIIGVEKKEVKKIIKALKEDYAQRDHSLLITQEADTWKINVREKYLDLVRKIVADTELPKTVLETLAVIAWKSPVVQSDIVKIRGNKCYEHIALLEEMGFITKIPEGRSYIVKVTEKFFEYFDVEGDKNLKDLFKDVHPPAKDTAQQSLEQSNESITQVSNEQTASEETETANEGEPLVAKDSDISELKPEEELPAQNGSEEISSVEQKLEEKEDALEDAVDTKELKAEIPEDIMEKEAQTGTIVQGPPLSKTESEVLQEVEEEVKEEEKQISASKSKKSIRKNDC